MNVVHPTHNVPITSTSSTYETPPRPHVGNASLSSSSTPPIIITTSVNTSIPTHGGVSGDGGGGDNLINHFKNPKKDALINSRKSRSVETDIVKPGEYNVAPVPCGGDDGGGGGTGNIGGRVLSLSASTTPMKAPAPDTRVYSIQITRSISTKELEPRFSKAAEQTPEKKIRRKVVGKKANSLDTTPPDPTDLAILMVKCISKAVYSVMRINDVDKGEQVEAFIEDSRGFPALDVVHQFFDKIFTSKNLSAECAVTAAAYVDRLDYVSNIKLNHLNWRRVCFICILEADKVLRDKLVWNEDYKDLLPSGIDLFDLRKLERNFLKYIQFNLTLTQSDYARYYFDLLSLKDATDVEPTQQPPLPQKFAQSSTTTTTTTQAQTTDCGVSSPVITATPKSARKESWLVAPGREKIDENKS